MLCIFKIIFSILGKIFVYFKIGHLSAYNDVLKIF